MHFVSDPSFDQFKQMCDMRYKGEKQFLTDGFIEPDIPEPFTDGRIYGMFFFGGDKATRRVFSGYLSLLRGELITIYIEGPAPAESKRQSNGILVSSRVLC